MGNVAPPVGSAQITNSHDVLSSLRFVDEVAELAAIFTATTNVVTLRRTPPSGLLDDAERAAQTPGFRRFFEIEPQAGAKTLGDELAGFSHLAADVQFWAQVLVDLTGCDSIGVRLALMTRAMCPRFHVDKVALRLVMTYQGPGTELVSSDHVDRRHLGHVAGDSADEVGGLLLTPDCVRRACAFDVVLLKGEAWPDNQGLGAVHRSPAITGALPRLVMTLDPL